MQILCTLLDGSQHRERRIICLRSSSVAKFDLIRVFCPSDESRTEPTASTDTTDSPWALSIPIRAVNLLVQLADNPRHTPSLRTSHTLQDYPKGSEPDSHFAVNTPYPDRERQHVMPLALLYTTMLPMTSPTLFDLSGIRTYAGMTFFTYFSPAT